MAIPTFAPTITPSYESSRTERIRTDQIRTIKYTQYRPLGVRPLKSISLQWEYIPDPQQWATFEEVDGGALGGRSYWVSYSWYHNSSAQESNINPRRNFSVSANKLIKVTVPVIPIPGDRTRIYADTTTTMTLQATLDPGVRTWTEPPTGLVSGAATPTANDLWQPTAWILGGPVAAVKFAAQTWRLSIDLQEQLRVP
jgi:hypothetical protein